MTLNAGIRLSKLEFTGPNATPAELMLEPGLNILYGASNTGKSFTLKAIDFMLGSSRTLPEIDERQSYESVWLQLDLPKSGDITLMRALAGGAYDLHLPANSAVRIGAGHNRRQLSARHDPSNTDNLSQFLLAELNLQLKSIAQDANGKKRSLSFRDLIRFCVVDETSIQSETSPIESGQFQLSTAERSVFKLLITGVDDNAIVPVIDRKTFRASTSGKIEVLDEMIKAISDELDSDYPNSADLVDQNKRLEESWALVQTQLQQAQDSIRAKLSRKRELAEEIAALHSRSGEIAINFERFEQLQTVYQSDVGRLEAIEEAGFLLSLSGGRECPLCGAPPDAHHHAHGTTEIEQARDAAQIEIKKINRQASDLQATLADLVIEGMEVASTLESLHNELVSVEQDISALAPNTEAAKQRLDETFLIRDRVRKGIGLIEQRDALIVRRDELSALKPASKAEKPKLGVSSATAHDFAQTVSKVLGEWRFPGNRHVTFDEVTYDLRIDGKNRKDNGKGVRAITHAAFKVALLLYCRERNLPHPGFLVLDTPLLTYRDPIHSKAGPLASDERELSQTSLKEYFFENLAMQAENNQFLIIENIDLPSNISEIANVQTFTGDPTVGREGLFYSRVVET